MFVFAGELMTKAGVTAAHITCHKPRRPPPRRLANVGMAGNLFMAGIFGSPLPMPQQSDLFLDPRNEATQIFCRIFGRM